MFAPWKKSYDQPRQQIKTRDITLPTKVHLVKAMVFPVVTYGCESWTIKKAEHQRTDAFELWCWRRLLRVPWIARRSNQSILKEISPEYSLERLMLKLKLQSFGHLMERTDSLEKTLMLGRIEGRRGDNRGWDGWMLLLTRWTWVWVNSGIWWWTGSPGVLQSMGLQRVRHDWVTELNWTFSLKKKKVNFCNSLGCFLSLTEGYYLLWWDYCLYINVFPKSPQLPHSGKSPYKGQMNPVKNRFYNFWCFPNTFYSHLKEGFFFKMHKIIRPDSKCF